MTAAPSENLVFDFGATYLNTEYLDFLSSGVFIPNSVFVGPGVPGNSNATRDVSGNDLVRTPPVTLNAGVNWTVPVGDDSSLVTTANLYVSEDYFFDVTNRVTQDGYALVSGQVRYNFPGGRYAVALFGRNLTDAKYYSIITPVAFGDQAQLSPPRTYGVTLSAKF